MSLNINRLPVDAPFGVALILSHTALGVVINGLKTGFSGGLIAVAFGFDIGISPGELTYIN